MGLDKNIQKNLCTTQTKMPNSDIVFDILQEKARQHEEFPFLFFESANYHGTRYPAQNEFPNWQVYLDWTDLRLEKIDSMYVPPHAILEVFSVQSSLAVIPGPALITKNSAYPIFWRNPDDSECNTQFNPVCGTKVQWNLDHIKTFFVKRRKNWKQFLHDSASRKIPLTLKGKPIHIDMDAFFDKICPSPFYNCQCFDTYHNFKKDHPSVKNVYVNNLNTNCIPDKHYLPKKSKIGHQTQAECIEMINQMSSSWKSLDYKGENQDFITCGNKKYYKSTENRTHTVDDEMAKENLDKGKSSTELPMWVVYTIILLIALCFLKLCLHFVK